MENCRLTEEEEAALDETKVDWETTKGGIQKPTHVVDPLVDKGVTATRSGVPIDAEAS